VAGAADADAAAAADDDAAAAAAARPSGLPSELPGEVAEATAASQLSDSSVWLTGDALEFASGGSVRSCWCVTMQFGHDN
jgi:hypothetical protein